jgi:hypothetical protein
MKKYVSILIVALTGCATLTEDAMTPIAMSFSEGSEGKCTLTNKRGVWQTELPTTISVRKSDDGLKYDCETDDGRKTVGLIPSHMGGKIVASAVFIDFGITDAITDKHREYPAVYVIPIAHKKVEAIAPTQASEATLPAQAPEAAPPVAGSAKPQR